MDTQPSPKHLTGSALAISLRQISSGNSWPIPVSPLFSFICGLKHGHVNMSQSPR